jgi:hypothetical protein
MIRTKPFAFYSTYPMIRVHYGSQETQKIRHVILGLSILSHGTTFFQPNFSLSFSSDGYRTIPLLYFIIRLVKRARWSPSIVGPTTQEATSRLQCIRKST